MFSRQCKGLFSRDPRTSTTSAASERPELNTNGFWMGLALPFIRIAQSGLLLKRRQQKNNIGNPQRARSTSNLTQIYCALSSHFSTPKGQQALPKASAVFFLLQTPANELDAKKTLWRENTGVRRPILICGRKRSSHQFPCVRPP